MLVLLKIKMQHYVTKKVFFLKNTVLRNLLAPT